jgi:hypothetical protein
VEETAIAGYLQPSTIVGNVADTVLDKVVPKEENFVPKYVTYGWIIPDETKK